MPRIRTLTAAGVLAGAAVLGGAGLAGATDGAPLEDPATADVEDGRQTEELTTFESEEEPETETGADEAPTAPALPDVASERARTAVAEAPAFAEEETRSTDSEQEAAEQDDHGQRVAEVAHDTEPGPDHGPAVAAVAKGGSSHAPGQQD